MKIRTLKYKADIGLYLNGLPFNQKSNNYETISLFLGQLRGIWVTTMTSGQSSMSTVTTYSGFCTTIHD